MGINLKSEMRHEMTNIIPFRGVTKSELSASDMLKNIADDCKPKHAFVICWYEDGLPSYHSSTGDAPVVLYRLQEFMHKEFSGDFS